MTLPGSLASMLGLRILSLHDSNILGPLSQQLESVMMRGSVSHIDLASNLISGTIPSSIGYVRLAGCHHAETPGERG